MSYPKDSEPGDKRVDFDMAWEMAHASKPDRDKAADIRARSERLAGSINPVRMAQRFWAKEKSGYVDRRAAGKEYEVGLKVRRDRKALEFYESLKGVEDVRALYEACADRAEDSGHADLAENIRANNAASPAEMVERARGRQYAAIGVLEQIGSRMVNPEQKEEGVELGLRDTEETLAILGLPLTRDDFFKRFRQGRTILLGVPGSDITVEFARQEKEVMRPGSLRYVREEYICAFVDSGTS